MNIFLIYNFVSIYVGKVRNKFNCIIKEDYIKKTKFFAIRIDSSEIKFWDKKCMFLCPLLSVNQNKFLFTLIAKYINLIIYISFLFSYIYIYIYIFVTLYYDQSNLLNICFKFLLHILETIYIYIYISAANVIVHSRLFQNILYTKIPLRLFTISIYFSKCHCFASIRGLADFHLKIIDPW